MMKRMIGGLTAACVLMLAGVSRAAIIYSDDFNRTGALNSSSPDATSGLYGGTAGATWTAASGITLTGTVAPFNGAALAYLPFSPQSGQVYTLTVYAQDLNDWAGIGFTRTATPSTAANLHNCEPVGGPGAPAWILYQNNVANTMVNQSGVASSSAGGSGYNTVALVLDTTGASWTLQGSMNGSPYGSVYTFATNPTINTVALSAAYGGGGMNTDSFSLTTSIPEPATLGMIGVTAIVMLLRKKLRG